MSIFQKYYDLYKSGQELGDKALNVSRVFFKEACPDEPPEFHRVLMHWFFSEYEMTAAAAPRGHAKSTMCSGVGILCAIAFRLHHNIIICSETLKQATDLLGAVKMELEGNEEFQRDFGIDMDTGVEAWNQEQIELRLKDGFRVRVSAKSQGSSMRGTKFYSWRPSLVLLDDIEGEENVSTPDQREKLHGWLLSVLLPALDPNNTRIRFVGTVLHEDSLLNKSLKNPKWYPAIFRAHNKNFSRLLWPSRFTKEKLLSLKEIYDTAGKAHLYYMEYLNRVIPDGGAFFATEKIEYVDNLPDGVDYHTGCDLAISQQHYSDYTVIATVAVKNDDMYICDIKRGRWTAFEIVEQMITTERQYHPSTFTIERGSIEKSIKPYLELEEQKNAVYLAKKYVSAASDKKTRARSLQGLIASGRVKVLRRIDNLKRTFYEMEKFGTADHDDIVDALVYCCQELQVRLQEEHEAKIEKELRVEVVSPVAEFFSNSFDDEYESDGWGS